MLTLTDLFCGAGGSSTGAIEIPGVEVRVASNHWDLAVETHNTNHPDADHLCADLSQIDPRRFPRTDILWASPECTNHSVAKGRKRVDSQPDLFGEVLPDAAAERSRATMWDVPRFAEAHHYQAVIVENVVDAWHWQPFQAWLMAMDSLGYEHHIVFLNSMHAQAFGLGAPQSRDRMYVVFWRKDNPRPDLDRVTRPPAVCPTCGPVRAMQVWKRADRAPWGRYRAQYVYRCPSVKCRNQILEPSFRPAAEIIDWSHLGQRIGDRAKPLAAKTLARIEAGIQRYWAPFITEHRHEYRVRGVDVPLQTVAAAGNHFGLAVPVEGRDGKQAAPVDQPTRTMTTRNETGLAFIAELRGGGSTHRPVSEPLATLTASGTHHGLVTVDHGDVTRADVFAGRWYRHEPKPLITSYYGNGGTRPADRELATVTTVETHALLDAPTINVDDVLFRMLEPREIARAMDFPAEYRILGNRREQVRQAGNAVTPPAARDLVGVVADSLGVGS
ncbi:DNA cytosine methyltransferase [Mycolicibacterium goodii]|uniref:DNA (cytosine-5-)-methyltransferase n=1 Tax=Mycolicibacterium goodii TaxID=134601 RepID=A0ABS6HS43_MYCGD|nr:DNA cytosine methyltransferase [Mycolicibacterium goodii]YP_009013622.1 DNA methyltransferase [Mycobacterium phage Dori]AER47721.1 DNA methyltransferase [Mycobacterium phage Dori]MBU8824153.1 DNA cytosine methyltransferase [Mycolicibacterium goodii]MBU8838063.1 DNA cytosine methyltransferase [Mycolicibacterium goodii]